MRAAAARASARLLPQRVAAHAQAPACFCCSPARPNPAPPPPVLTPACPLALQGQAAAETTLGPAIDDKSEIGKLLQTLLSNPTQLHALRVVLGVQTNEALPLLRLPSGGQGSSSGGGGGEGGAPAADAEAAGGGGRGSVAGGGGCGGASPAAANVPGPVTDDPPSYDVARDILEGVGEFATQVQSEHVVLRMSLKLFNKTPAGGGLGTRAHAGYVLGCQQQLQRVVVVAAVPPTRHLPCSPSPSHPLPALPSHPPATCPPLPCLQTCPPTCASGCWGGWSRRRRRWRAASSRAACT
jgi:hypothetical protein